MKPYSEYTTESELTYHTDCQEEYRPTPEEYGSTPEDFHESYSSKPKNFMFFGLNP